MLAQSIHYLFQAYKTMIFICIIGSWFPNLSNYRFFVFVKYYTEPFLNVFRKIIPPIGGVLDLSPILAFISLSFLETFIFSVIQ